MNGNLEWLHKENTVLAHEIAPHGLFALQDGVSRD